MIKKRKKLYGDFHHIGKEYQNNCLYYIEIEKVIQNDKYEHPENSDSSGKDKDEIEVSEMQNNLNLCMILRCILLY
ncbi:hypothetical protein [Alkaliphilus sp. B6464]|uniref:hypothetical protein n=1 Tax=Alkaliphilus sp. B6464 TaxID=2731219 RepID=UPI002011434E|nr:hypothetical protein [Alkaliphilus sp. B6464]